MGIAGSSLGSAAVLGGRNLERLDIGDCGGLCGTSTCDASAGVVHQEVPVGMLVHVPNEQVRLACTRHHRHQPEYLAVLVLKVVQVGADVLVAHRGRHHVHRRSRQPHPSFHLHQHPRGAVG